MAGHNASKTRNRFNARGRRDKPGDDDVSNGAVHEVRPPQRQRSATGCEVGRDEVAWIILKDTKESDCFAVSSLRSQFAIAAGNVRAQLAMMG